MPLPPSHQHSNAIVRVMTAEAAQSDAARGEELLKQLQPLLQRYLHQNLNDEMEIDELREESERVVALLASGTNHTKLASNMMNIYFYLILVLMHTFLIVKMYLFLVR